jgi:hypothetical protein
MGKRRHETDINESTVYPICESVIEWDIKHMMKTEAEALLNLRIPNAQFNFAGATSATRFLDENVVHALRQTLRHLQSGLSSGVVASCEDMHSGDFHIISRAVCTFLNALMSCTVNSAFIPISRKNGHSPKIVGFTLQCSLTMREFWHTYLPASTYRLDFVDMGCSDGYRWTQAGLHEVWTQMRRCTYLPFLDHFSSGDIQRCICEFL